MSAAALLAEPPELSPEDADRAGFYGVLANLMAAPPSDALLAALAGADRLQADPAVPEGEALATAWAQLCDAAGQCEGERVRSEWNALFWHRPTAGAALRVVLRNRFSDGKAAGPCAR